MANFFQEFVKGKLAADNMLKDKKIEIRFVYFVDDVVRMESLFKLSNTLISTTVSRWPKFQ
jgi:hypothetical protein